MLITMTFLKNAHAVIRKDYFYIITFATSLDASAESVTYKENLLKGQN